MSRLLIALLATAGLGLAGPVAAQLQTPRAAAAPMSKDALSSARADADARYKVDKEACSSLAGNANDICVAEAKGRDAVARAEAAAAYENTPKAREAAHVAYTQASYDVRIEKCDDLAGNRKDVCVKEAKAEFVKGTGDAKVDRVAAETRNDAASKQAEARKEAGAAKRDADYKVAIEKCDALAGAAKNGCASDAMARFGKP